RRLRQLARPAWRFVRAFRRTPLSDSTTGVSEQMVVHQLAIIKSSFHRNDSEVFRWPEPMRFFMRAICSAKKKDTPRSAGLPGNLEPFWTSIQVASFRDKEIRTA